MLKTETVFQIARMAFFLQIDRPLVNRGDFRIVSGFSIGDMVYARPCCFKKQCMFEGVAGQRSSGVSVWSVCVDLQI